MSPRRRLAPFAAAATGLGLALAVAGCGASTPTSAPLTVPTAAPLGAGVVAQRLAAGLPLFDYNANAAIAVTSTADAADSTSAATVSDLNYLAAGGWVKALLVEPAGDGLHPAVILLGDLGGSRRDLLPRAVDLANAGVLSLVIEPPPGLTYTPQDRDSQIRFVVDLRQAFDVVAARPDVDQHAIGFLGSGYGASMGGLFAGVDSRLAAAVLASGNGGLVAHVATLGDAGPLASLAPGARDAWINAMEPIEPVYFVGNAAAPVLFQAGTLDTVTTPAESARFVSAGNAQSKVDWYETAHGLSDDASCDAAKFLGDHLGFDGSAVNACGTAPAPADPVSWIAIVGLFALMIAVRLIVRLRQRRPPPEPDAEPFDPNAPAPPIIRPPKP
jgi:dienelactone hydrolase